MSDKSADQSSPILVEERTSEFGEWVEHWHCQPPPLDMKYVVLDEEWDGDDRHIYDVLPIGPFQGDA